MFDHNGLGVNDDLWRRALLSKGDYLLSHNLNRSFLIDSHRDISWKRLLRDPQKRDLVRQLLDDIDPQNAASSLQNVIDNCNVSDWRYYFIQYENLIEHGCGTNKYIRMKNAHDILLLNSSTTAGYCKEYYTYALYYELKKSCNMLSYIDSRGVDYYKYIEIKSNNSTIIITYVYDEQTGEWGYEVEIGNVTSSYATQQEVIDFLKNQQYI
ncbi:hypothetical protein D3C76_1267270 [compost metagenome]